MVSLLENPVGEGSCQLSSDISFVPAPKVRVARAGGVWGRVEEASCWWACDAGLPHGSQGRGQRGRGGDLGRHTRGYTHTLTGPYFSTRAQRPPDVHRHTDTRSDTF